MLWNYVINLWLFTRKHEERFNIDECNENRTEILFLNTLYITNL